MTPRGVCLAVFAVAVLPLAVACTSAPKCPPAPSPVALEVPPPPPAADAGLASTPRGRGDSPCFAKGRPSVPPATTNAERPYCAPFDELELKSVEQRVRAAMVLHDKQSLLVVDWGCDEAYGPVREMVLEDGSGHGGSLRVVRFQWQTDGRVTVRKIASSHYYQPGVTVEQAETSATQLAAIVATSRVALLARPHVVRLRTKGGGSRSFGSSSTNDFHLLLRLVDDEGRVTENRFSGYERSSEQEHIVPMRLATEPIRKLLEGLAFAPTAKTDEDRAFFTARLTRTLATKPFWWVKERYVANAAVFGTVDAIPSLVALTGQKGEASADRTRVHALDALAAITGWDPRVDGAGKRTLDEAAELAREACEP